MSYEAMGKLIDRWVEDKEFRKEMRLNAEMAVRKSGIQLAPEEWSVLHQVNWKMPDDELQARISKL